MNPLIGPGLSGRSRFGPRMAAPIPMTLCNRTPGTWRPRSAPLAQGTRFATRRNEPTGGKRGLGPLVPFRTGHAEPD